MSNAQQINYEKKRVEFPSAWVCLHFVCNAAGHEPANRELEDKTNPFFSFELDLLAQSYQEKPPFFSNTCPATTERLYLALPGETEIYGEGVAYRLTCPPDLRFLGMKPHLSYTHFWASQKRVWHLSLEAHSRKFCENDLLILSKLKGDFLERSGLEKEKLFALEPEGEKLSPDQLLDKLCPSPPRGARLKGVTIMIESSKCKLVGLPKLSAKDLDQAIAAAKNPADGLEKLCASIDAQRRRSDEQKILFDLLGGVMVGIMDYEGCDLDEIADAFEPCIPIWRGIISLCRGILFCAQWENREMKAVGDKIGMSPYLVIPHAVLLHNHALIEESADILEDGRPASGNPWSLEGMDKALAEVDRKINYHLLANVFHYRTEKEIFERGMEQSGARQILGVIQQRYAEIKARADAIRKRKQLVATWVSSVALGLLAALTSHAIIDDVFDDLLDSRFNKYEWGILAVAVAVFLGVSIWAAWLAIKTSPAGKSDQGRSWHRPGR